MNQNVIMPLSNDPRKLPLDHTLFFNRITNYNNQCFKIQFKGKSAFQL